MLYKLIFPLGLIIFSVFSIQAQEQIGLRTGNYAGVNSIFSNPAFSSQSPLKWDINIMTGHLFAETDYAFVRNTNLFHLLRNKDQVSVIKDLYNPVDSVTSLPLYFDTNGGDKFASFKASVMGPSAIFNIGKGFTGGFYFSYNMNGSAQRIPAILGYYELKDLPLSTSVDQDTIDYRIQPSRFAAMNWMEIGMHLSKTLFNDSYTNTAVGLNFKYLIGHDGVYARNDETIVFNKLESGQFLFNNTEAELGFTTTALDSSSIEFKSNGRGIAFDLGISYLNGNSKWGFSLLDLGWIRFNKNSEVHQYSSEEVLDISSIDYENIDDYRELINQASQDFPEVNLDSLTRNNRSFSIWLPTALSVQYDRKFSQKLYVNAGIVHRLPLGKNRLERDNMLFVAPRFETRMVSFFLPLTWYNFEKIHLGFTARIGVFSIGSDNLSSLFGKHDFDGTDIYASVKINPFRRVGNSNREVKCFYFDK